MPRTVLKPSRSGKLARKDVQRAIFEVQISQEEIAKRAFEKFAARGYVHGFDDQDWLDAHQELIAEAHKSN